MLQLFQPSKTPQNADLELQMVHAVLASAAGPSEAHREQSDGPLPAAVPTTLQTLNQPGLARQPDVVEFDHYAADERGQDLAAGAGGSSSTACGPDHLKQSAAPLDAVPDAAQTRRQVLENKIGSDRTNFKYRTHEELVKGHEDKVSNTASHTPASLLQVYHVTLTSPVLPLMRAVRAHQYSAEAYQAARHQQCRLQRKACRQGCRDGPAACTASKGAQGHEGV